MALSSPQLQRFLLKRTTDPNPIYRPATTPSNKKKKIIVKSRGRSRCCSAIAIDAPSFSTGVSGLRLGSTQLQGLREEMEDDVVIVRASDELDGFSFAAVFDGHAGFSSVKFLRDELYKECVRALQGGLLLSAKEFDRITNALQEAFQNADRQLINWLEETGDQVESGSTATVMFLRNEKLVIAHVGDSCVVISRSGKEEVVTNPHRPYGNNKTSLQEIKRIREAGGWINNGRICGDIAVSRAFGDMRFKTKKDEMLEKGIEEKRWSEKFVSRDKIIHLYGIGISHACNNNRLLGGLQPIAKRVRFNGDLVTATPDIYQVSLGSDAEFILLASDGLWDYVKSSEAVNLVRNQLKQHGDVQLACEALGRTALDRRSQDNISIIIADLGRTDWRKLPQQQGNFVFELSQAFATIGIVSLGVLWMSSVFSS